MKKVAMLFREKDAGTDYQSSAMNWWFGILEYFNYDVFYYDYSGYDSHDFYRQCKEEKVDFIFHTCYDKIHTEFVRLREFSKIYLLHTDVNFRYDIYTRFWIPFIDGVVCYDEGNSVDDVPAKLAKDYIDPNVILKMSWGFNPATMSYPSFPYKDRNILLSFVGGLHANRLSIINEFQAKGQSVFMPPRQTTNYEQAKDVWSHSKFSLCFTMNSRMDKRVIPGRIVEIASHCVLLSEPCPGLERYFQKGTEYVEFDSVDNAIRLINSMPEDLYMYFLCNSQRKIWNELTVFHQWNKILPKIDPDFKPRTKDEIQQLLKSNFNHYVA